MKLRYIKHEEYFLLSDKGGQKFGYETEGILDKLRKEQNAETTL
jgi:hypothetical protein